jgi:hypothetical protein
MTSQWFGEGFGGIGDDGKGSSRRRTQQEDRLKYGCSHTQEETSTVSRRSQTQVPRFLLLALPRTNSGTTKSVVPPSLSHLPNRINDRLGWQSGCGELRYGHPPFPHHGSPPQGAIEPGCCIRLRHGFGGEPAHTRQPPAPETLAAAAIVPLQQAPAKTPRTFGGRFILRFYPRQSAGERIGGRDPLGGCQDEGCQARPVS